MTASSSVSVAHLWYVQAAGQAWGPYTEARMAAFVAEGRISASSLVSPWSSGPFMAAAATPEFASLVRAAPARPEPDFQHLPRPIPQASTLHAPMPQAPVPSMAAPQTPVVEFAPLPAGAGVADAVGAPVQPAGGAVRALLVWASLASITSSAFEAVLGAYGPCAAIRPGLWLVQARLGPAPLRNALSRRLRDGDALLVVEAPLERAAWFNLDQVSEQELRRLWIV